jgi:protein-S-isoprenylcysteine O-methyltransferase Ste14
VVALYSLRAKAAVPSLQDGLVQSGLYGRVRNPIHSGTMLEFAGLALLFPTLPVLLACALGVLWVLLQTRCDEYDLLQRLPAYRHYMQRVPRFIPRISSSSK